MAVVPGDVISIRVDASAAGDNTVGYGWCSLRAGYTIYF